MFETMKTMDVGATKYGQMFERYEKLVAKIDGDEALTDTQRLVVLVGVLLGTVGVLLRKFEHEERVFEESFTHEAH